MVQFTKRKRMSNGARCVPIDTRGYSKPMVSASAERSISQGEIGGTRLTIVQSHKGLGQLANHIEPSSDWLMIKLEQRSRGAISFGLESMPKPKAKPITYKRYSTKG